MRVLVMMSAMVLAQPDASLRVTVTDPSGAVIVGASVEMVSPERTATILASDARGESVFERVVPGRYTLRVASAGFEPYEARDIRIRGGQNRRTVKLTLAKLAETVTVARDPSERASDPRGDAFTTLLTPSQIEQLPDDPEEMERVLLEMAGPGATLRVNGFRSNRLPPKDQIQQIRFRRNAFAAESHDAGAVFVDVMTRPGGEQWRGSTGAAFRSSALNARNALAVRKADEAHQRYSLTLSGPVWKKHTSASLSVDATSAVDARTIFAILPSGPFSELGRRPLASANVTGRLEHALSPAHVLRLEFDHGSGRLDGAGVGDFNLPERGYRQTNDGRALRASAVGSLGRAAYNELRFQLRSDHTAFSPASHSPAILVLNTFHSGGAQVAGARESRQLEFADDIDIARGRHAVRAGVLVEQVRVESDVARNAGGTFTFASLDAFRAGQPTTYSRNVGDPDTNINISQIGWYVQDDIRVRRNLTLSAGVRQEHQSIVGGWHLGPRAAVVWSPFASGRTSVRAGAGIFFDWFDAHSYEYAVQLDGSHQHIETIVDPSYPLAAGLAFALPAGRVRLADRIEQPRVGQALIAVEQALSGDLRVNATVSARRVDRALRGVNVNSPIGGRRPDPASGAIIEITSQARAHVDSLAIQATYSPSQRPLFLTASYTLSRSENDTDGPTSVVADSRHLDAEWGPAADDVRQRFTALVSSPIVGRVRFGTSVRVQSGSPYNVTTGHDDNGDTLSNDRPLGVFRNSARGAIQAEISARVGWTIGFVKRPSTGGTPGVMARTKGDGDALAAFGGAVDLTKRFNLEIFAQAFNLLNRANVTSYSGVRSSSLFGQAIAVAPPRRFELGARLRF